MAIHTLIKRLHWPRIEGDLPVAYNGAQPALSCGASTSTKKARRAQPLNDREVQFRPDATAEELGLADFLATVCPLMGDGGLGEATSSAVPKPTTLPTTAPAATDKILPSDCYNFDVNCYGHCCADAPGGTCSTMSPGAQGCRCATDSTPACPMPTCDVFDATTGCIPSS